MGETTNIAWSDATHNHWIGCTKVSQGCKFCYAETQNNFYKWNRAGWGPGVPRKLTSEANRKKPLAWAREAVKQGVTRRVFCSSLSDVFDGEVEQEWREDLWKLIDQTGEIGGLEWLILTKRPENISGMIPAAWSANPPDYVRIGTTTEDQPNADKRIPHLFDAWSGKTFLSIEPMLGPIDLVKVVREYRARQLFLHKCGIDWVICGGESGPNCRPMKLEWARDLRDQCAAAGVPWFFKQLGGHPNKGHDPEQWPADLRIQQVPW